jgi:hypothetical protein
MKSIALGDILTSDQCRQVFDIAMSSKTETEMHLRLMDLFVPMRKELEAKGVLPEYLAHALPFFLLEIALTHSPQDPSLN